jgi:uncharacterized membrane protein YeaQ/YmgE (transglycosylase-associated protein family)
MNPVTWFVLGVLAGVISKVIYPGHQRQGIFPTILLGIAGAFVGGSLAAVLMEGGLSIASTTLSNPGVILAVLGAIVAIFIWRGFSHQNTL